ncbi:type-2 angiotensin II receptor [Ambystoma mexicanum]|uniref:type-2 angiotensin II receptor n=1 Tax=Ambystoma mexicanum TaxID=8296 RepID=UPI0037E7D822
MYNGSFSTLITSQEPFTDSFPLSPNLSVVQTSSSPCQLSANLDYQFELIPVIYGMIFTIGFLGNCVVVTVLCLHNGPKTIANFYIFNLAVADLLFLATLPLWASYYAVGYSWLFGSVMCKISGSLLCLNLFASIFFITCMSVDRYLAIVHPFRSQRRTLHQANLVAVAVWGLAGLASLPTFYFREIQFVEQLGVNACVMAFPNDTYAEWRAGTALFKNGLGFCVPMVVIASCYLGIGKHLIRSRRPGKIKQNRDKVLRIFAAVILAFLTCWLPFHILTFLDALTRMDIIENCAVKYAVDAAMPFSICLGFANSSINPLLYCFVGNQFQENFMDIFQLKAPQTANSQQSASSRKGSDTREAEPAGISASALQNGLHPYCLQISRD